MQDESISTINVYDLERAARRQAYEECAAICEAFDDGAPDSAHNETVRVVAKAIRAKLETDNAG